MADDSKTQEQPKTQEQSEEGQRSFATFLRTVDGGSFLVELGEELHGMNEKLQGLASQVGRASGELKVTFKFKHEQNGQVDVHTDLAVKLPKIQRARSTFWVTRGFNLADRDPRQLGFSFRDVNKPSPARDVTEAPKAARSV